MPDANLDQAVDGIMGAAYGSAGEMYGSFSGCGRRGNCRSIRENINKKLSL